MGTNSSLGLVTNVFDMGQNIVGWSALTLSNAAGMSGSNVIIRYAELLELDSNNCVKTNGNIDRSNLRQIADNGLTVLEATNIDRYTLNNDPVQRFQPHFTYHGFRYVDVTAPTTNVVALTTNSLTGCVINSGAPLTAVFSCSDTNVSKLMTNILWTIRGNLYGVFTDAPQRAEREGYMGSEMIISQTACFDIDMAAFYTKWIRDIRLAQDSASGAYAIYAPWNNDRWGDWDPGWQVGGIVFPWHLYLNYGDTRMLAEHYQSATNWVRYMLNGPTISYGDWLDGDFFYGNPSGWNPDLRPWPIGWGTKHAFVDRGGYGTAYTAYSADLAGAMSRVLQQYEMSQGNTFGAATYATMYTYFTNAAAQARTAYTNSTNAIVSYDANGNITNIGNGVGTGIGCQGDSVGALCFNVIPDTQRSNVVASLLLAGGYGISNYNTFNTSGVCSNHLSTGNQFAGRELLVLSKSGYTWKSYELLTKGEFPSWMYQITNQYPYGATTCWERWNSYLSGAGSDRGYAQSNSDANDMSYNSFNSLPFGAVGEWIWTVVAGIDPDQNNAGFKNVIVCPQAGAGISWCSNALNSIHGLLLCAWTNNSAATNCSLSVTVPANTTAFIFIPTTNLANITESGVPAASISGLLGYYPTNLPNWFNGVTVFQVGAGAYNFAGSNFTFTTAGGR